jgi:hypothetical protein
VHNPPDDDHRCTPECLDDEDQSTSYGQGNEQPPKGRTAPAMITAVATLITALAALVTAFR